VQVYWTPSHSKEETADNSSVETTAEEDTEEETETVEAPQAPTDVAGTVSKTTATITWSAVEDADGYTVFQANGDGSTYKDIGGTTDKTKLAVKELTKGKSYKFKVRAYKTVDGKNIYSEDSEVITVKVPKK
jgi:hypothetical protein